MTEVDLTRANKVRTFEQRALNRSVTDLYFFEKLADIFLEYLPQSISPNLLSFLSFFPLFVFFPFATCNSRLSYFFATLVFLLHQLLDIANKKQAYRLNIFSLSTYYIDHLFDSLSLICIAIITFSLLGYSNQLCLLGVYVFAMLPFYLHHLAMYHNGYLVFPCLSPPSEGLLIIEILFLIFGILPNLPTVELVTGIRVAHVLTGLGGVWLIIFVAMDLRILFARFNKGKNETESKELMRTPQKPIKYLYVILALGYLAVESVVLGGALLEDFVCFAAVLTILGLVYSHIINSLVLAYGYGEQFKQITVFFLVISALINVFYGLTSFVKQSDEIQVGRVVLIIYQACSLIYYIISSRMSIRAIQTYMETA